MIILAIDTSCDDTCLAILEIQGSKFKVRSNIVSSQVKIHQKYGGVYPTLAKREHQKNLVPVLKKALKEANLLKKIPLTERKLPRPRSVKQGELVRDRNLRKILEREEVLFKKLKGFLEKYQKPLKPQNSEIDLISVTVGPGLDPCLWVGVNFAKALSYFWNLPIVPVNHIEAHIAANFIEGNSKLIKFPAVCLIVSGGHTQLILMEKIGDRPPISRYKIIGETRDDAAGECFDKTARILGLLYPGGPAIAKEAAKTSNSKFQIKLPRPMIKSKDYDFSFSGLKTAVLYDFKKRPKKTRTSKEYIREMAKEIQQAVVDVLIEKTIKAAKEYKAKTIILGGGVTANKELRKQFKEKIKKDIINSKLLIPDPKLCTDNAAMIAVAGYSNWLEGKKKNWKQIEADANLRI